VHGERREKFARLDVVAFFGGVMGAPLGAGQHIPGSSFGAGLTFRVNSLGLLSAMSTSTEGRKFSVRQSIASEIPELEPGVLTIPTATERGTIGMALAYTMSRIVLSLERWMAMPCPSAGDEDPTVRRVDGGSRTIVLLIGSTREIQSPNRQSKACSKRKWDHERNVF